MIKLSEETQIFICSEPIDMRRSINGLGIAVVETLNKNPQTNALFLFYNKSKNKVKALIWDHNGFMLFYKALEKGHFKFPKECSGNELVINEKQLSWLLAGFDFIGMNQRSDLNFTDYF